MISRSYPGSELLNQIDNNGNIVGVPPRSHAERHNEIDVGYDTDTIAIFEIDKAFTDYLLCQICFSKLHQTILFSQKRCKIFSCFSLLILFTCLI